MHRFRAWCIANHIASRARIEIVAACVIQKNAKVFVARIKMGSIRDVLRAEKATKIARAQALVQRREDMHRKREVETEMYIEHHNAVSVE